MKVELDSSTGGRARWMLYLPEALLSAADVPARVVERTARGWNVGCCGGGSDVGCVGGLEFGIPPPPNAADGVAAGEPWKPANGTGVGVATGLEALRGGAGDIRVRSEAGDGLYAGGGESPAT